MHIVIRWKSMLYQSTEHGAELKLSHHLPICAMSDNQAFNHFPDFSLAFFFWFIEFWSKEVATEKTKQRFANMPSIVIDIIITWAETKILN